MPVRQEEQLGTLIREGYLSPDPDAKGRLERAEPFLDNLAADTGLRRGGAEDRQRDQQTRSVWRSLSRVGVRSVTVVNLMPFPIEVTCGVHRHFVQAAKWNKGEPWHARTFDMRDVRMDQCDLGDGKVSPMALYPIDIAIEFQDKYIGKEGEVEEDEQGNKMFTKPGGVFVYEGTADNPPQNFNELLKVAEERFDNWCWMQYQAGEAAWEKHRHDPQWIQNRMKDAAHRLYRIGKIATLPGWVAAKKEEAGIKECPNCAEVVKVAAKQCRFCGAVLHADGGFTRRGESLPERTPEPEAQPVAAPRAEASQTAELDESGDLDVLNSEETQEPRPARPSKKKAANNQPKAND